LPDASQMVKFPSIRKGPLSSTVILVIAGR
jgi:hypothetical protein